MSGDGSEMIAVAGIVRHAPAAKRGGQNVDRASATRRSEITLRQQPGGVATMDTGNLWGWFIDLPSVFHLMAGAFVVGTAWVFWATRRV